ncbi:hypothetical protein HYU19_04060 [Candidatus Woesearchaeota archaeon]|nr:hypothetical protein [Candidatus Woesearchaeota archaeon]
MAGASRSSDDPLLHLVSDTLERNKQALVFVNSKRSAEKSAEDLARKIKQARQASPGQEKLAHDVLHTLSTPTKQCERLASCVKKGIAFHHAGLTQKQKDLIEDHFREGTVKVICCTPTLAAGVDLPAFRAILRDLRRFSGPRGLSWIPVLEYQQMAGRAGRPSYDAYGEAIAIASTEKDRDEIYSRYLLGEPEEIYSKLAVEPVLRTYLLSLIATGFVSTKVEILSFFEKTFWAHQFGDMARLEEIITKVLRLLEEYEFITTPIGLPAAKKKEKKAIFVSAADLADGKIEATIIGKRVAELYLDPLSAHELIECLQHASAIVTSAALNEFSYLHAVSCRLEMRPLLTIKTREWEDIQAQFNQYQDLVLQPEPSLYDEEYEGYMNSVKTALFFNEWINEKDEEFLLGKYDVRPGEVHAKIAIADWLLYSAEELAKLLKLHAQIKDILKTRFRLKYGVREELFPLLKLGGVGRVRARKLFNNGIRDLGDVKKADITTLSQMLGKQIAISVKKQVGIDIDKEIVPENKRRGQLSLKDY